MADYLDEAIAERLNKENQQLRTEVEALRRDSRRLKAANKARDELAAQCGEERDYWEQCIKDAAARAGIDVSGTIGNASLHMIVEEVERLKTEAKDKQMYVGLNVYDGGRADGRAEGMEAAAKVDMKDAPHIRRGDLDTWEAGWHRGVRELRAAILEAAKEQADG